MLSSERIDLFSNPERIRFSTNSIHLIIKADQLNIIPLVPHIYWIDNIQGKNL